MSDESTTVTGFFGPRLTRLDPKIWEGVAAEEALAQASLALAEAERSRDALAVLLSRALVALEVAERRLARFEDPKRSRLRVFAVICRADRKPDGSKGDFELATSRSFSSLEDANRYAGHICDSREPRVVEVSEAADAAVSLHLGSA